MKKIFATLSLILMSILTSKALAAPPIVTCYNKEKGILLDAEYYVSDYSYRQTQIITFYKNAVIKESKKFKNGQPKQLPEISQAQIYKTGVATFNDEGICYSGQGCLSDHFSSGAFAVDIGFLDLQVIYGLTGDIAYNGILKMTDTTSGKKIVTNNLTCFRTHQRIEIQIVGKSWNYFSN